MRKFKILSISILMFCGMSACNISGNVTVQDPDTGNKPEVIEQIPDTDNKPEVIEQIPEVMSSDILYNKFLSGEEVLYFDEKATLNIDYIFDEFVSDEYRLDFSKGYTLEETIDAIRYAIWEDEESTIGSCGYYMIDAGGDKNPELCVELSDFTAPDWDNITLIIKEIDGKLQCLYVMVSRSRFGYEVTYDGVISGGGSGGAGYHVYDESFIDSNGECVFLYEEESLMQDYDSYISDAFERINDKMKEAFERINNDANENGYFAETLFARFEDKYPTEDYIAGFIIYDKNNREVEETNPVYDEIRQIFADEGVEVLSMDDFNDTIDERCLEKGFDAEMRHSFDKIEYHSLFDTQEEE